MFRHRNQLRRWAARVLFLWLIAVGTGVANACLSLPGTVPGGITQEHEPASHQVEVGFEAAREHTASPVLHEHGSQDSPDSLAKANCQDFCDRASTTLPLSKSVQDDVQGQAAVPSAAMATLPEPAVVGTPVWMPRPSVAPPPPILIAFLRLAL